MKKQSLVVREVIEAAASLILGMVAILTLALVAAAMGAK